MRRVARLTSLLLPPPPRVAGGIEIVIHQNLARSRALSLLPLSWLRSRGDRNERVPCLIRQTRLAFTGIVTLRAETFLLRGAASISVADALRSILIFLRSRDVGFLGYLAALAVGLQAGGKGSRMGEGRVESASAIYPSLRCVLSNHRFRKRSVHPAHWT